MRRPSIQRYGGDNGFDLTTSPTRMSDGSTIMDRRSSTEPTSPSSTSSMIPDFQEYFNGFLKSTLGGWQVSGIVEHAIGAPINITYGWQQRHQHWSLTSAGIRCPAQPDRTDSNTPSSMSNNRMELSRINGSIRRRLPLRQLEHGAISDTTHYAVLAGTTGTCHCSRASSSVKAAAAVLNCVQKASIPGTTRNSKVTSRTVVSAPLWTRQLRHCHQCLRSESLPARCKAVLLGRFQRVTLDRSPNHPG